MLTFDHLHDHRTINRVTRILARRQLREFGALTFLMFSVSFKLFEEAVNEGFRSVLDTDDYGAPIVFGLLAAFLLWQLWKSAKGLGATLYGAFMPLDLQRNGQIDGVTQGDATVTLSDESVGWMFEDVQDEIHLAAFFAGQRSKDAVLLQSTLAESHFLAVDDAKVWFDGFRKNKKQASKSGWPLPSEDESVQHYDLLADVYLAAQARDTKAPPPTTALLWPIIALGIWVIIFMGNIWRFSKSDTFGIQQVGLFFLITWAVFTLVAVQARVVWIGWNRQRQGLTIDGRDFVGVTHGPTACSITQDGIEIYRAYFRQKIKWNAVKCVDLWGGWLAFRAGDHTLAIVTDTNEVRACITKAGLQPPEGPWATAKTLQTWGRVA